MTVDDERSETARMRVVQIEQLLEERDQLIHDLEVYQAELEAQNRQLRDAQDLLEVSRARYSDLYDLAPVAYCTLDVAGCVTEINLTGATMLATPRGRVIGKPFAVYVAGPDRPAYRTHLLRCMSSPTGQAVVDLTLVNSATPQIVIQIVSIVARDPSGTIIGCRSAFTDITEQKRAEESLQLAVRMRQDFLAIVSHDLRSPLNTILLGSEVLEVSETLDSASLRNVALIKRAGQRMSRMLGDLLDLSSMEAGHLSMDRKSESIDDLLSAVVDNAGPTAAAKSVRLSVVRGLPGLTVFCDRDRVLQVLMNLVGNAIKFSGAQQWIGIEANVTRDKVEFSVRDSGVGIAKAQLDHIFDPYWQVAKTAKLGTGLGLAIARGIVEFHGGRIWAESVVGRGTCFFFTLPSSAPAAEPPVEAARVRPRASSGPLSGVHRLDPGPSSRGPILVVDDDLDVHTLLAQLLGAEGHEVVAAGDGVRALEYLRGATTLPSLIILDLVMPNMDGWQFIEERRLDSQLAAIPVVLISGQLDSREVARALGLASYLEKPIVAARLRDMLARFEGSGAASPEERA